MQHFGGFNFTGALYNLLFGTDAIWRQLRMAKIKPNLSHFPWELEGKSHPSESRLNSRQNKAVLERSTFVGTAATHSTSPNSTSFFPTQI